MSSIDKLKEFIVKHLLRCKHKKTSWPITSKSELTGGKTTYITCLDCGKCLTYDWDEMEICQ